MWKSLQSKNSVSLVCDLFILIGFILISYQMSRLGIHHADTTNWIKQVGKFNEGFYIGWNFSQPYPPLPQLFWYLMCQIDFIPHKFILVIPNILSMCLLYVMMRQKHNLIFSATLILLNPFFLISGIVNGYTDVTFVFLSAISLYYLKEKQNYKLFIYIGLICFLYKFQYIYIAFYILIVWFNDFDKIRSFVKSSWPHLLICLGFLALISMRLPFYEGNLDRPYAFMYALAYQSKLPFIVARTYSLSMLIFILKNGYGITDPTAWGDGVWVGRGLVKDIFMIFWLTYCLFLRFFTESRKYTYLFLVFFGAIVLGPSLVINHIVTPFVAIIFCLLFDNEPKHKKIYFMAFLFLSFLYWSIKCEQGFPVTGYRFLAMKLPLEYVTKMFTGSLLLILFWVGTNIIFIKPNARLLRSN